MKQSKYFYTKLSHVGYAWGGFWDKTHHFVKQVKSGYAHVQCAESDIEDGSWVFMCENGISR